MHFGNLLYPTLLALLVSSDVAEAARRPGRKVLLSNVETLTLQKDRKTASRHGRPVPQLKCIGGDGKGLYEVDVMRCKNSGADYDDESIQWTCKADLPPEFRLGSTDVICESYDGPDDPYILKGSCSVDYRLALTEKGLKKYGKRRGQWWTGFEEDIPPGKDWTSTVVAGSFWLLFLGVLFYMIFKACIVGRGDPRVPRTWTGPRFDGGGGGGGGGWGGGPPPYDDPPPPYSPRYYRKYHGTSREGWRPGFWSGAFGGATAGYFAGRQASRNNSTFGGSRWNDAGVGPSGTYRQPPSSSSPSPSSERYVSTGFGSTRRR